MSEKPDGEVLRIDHPDGTAESFTYNVLGQVLTHTDGKGQTTRLLRTARGLPSSRQDAKGQRIRYEHDKVPVKPDKVSPELYKERSAKTPRAAIRKAVNKDVVFPMKDPALPGLQVVKPLHADHIVPMKTITEMNGFSKLTIPDQVKVLNYEKNFQGLSEVANTSKGAKSFFE